MRIHNTEINCQNMKSIFFLDNVHTKTENSRSKFLLGLGRGPTPATQHVFATSPEAQITFQPEDNKQMFIYKKVHGGKTAVEKL